MPVMNYIRLLRPEQWLKNLFVFLPIFFGKYLFELACFVPTLVTFVAFSFAAGSIYCFNDIVDVEKDKQHPKKAARPIANGSVSVRSAYLVMLIALCLSVSTSLAFGGETKYKVLLVIGLYYILNIFYTTILKHRAIIDVFIIALGFVLRILAGGVSTETVLSHWIILMTFLLALFLAFAKRRDDIIISEDE